MAIAFKLTDSLVGISFPGVHGEGRCMTTPIGRHLSPYRIILQATKKNRDFRGTIFARAHFRP
jgi:hypothetical protein